MSKETWMSWAFYLALFAVAAAALYGEVRLSRKKSFLPGLIPIVLTLAVFSGLWIWFLGADPCTEEKTLRQELASGNTLEVTLRLDAEGQVVSMYDPVVKDSEGRIMEYVDWWEDGPYSRVFAKMQKHYSFDSDTQRYFNEYEHGIQVGNTALSGVVIPVGGALIILPLAAVYIVQRSKVRRKKREEELHRINIASL